MTTTNKQTRDDLLEEMYNRTLADELLGYELYWFEEEEHFRELCNKEDEFTKVLTNQTNQNEDSELPF